MYGDSNVNDPIVDDDSEEDETGAECICDALTRFARRIHATVQTECKEHGRVRYHYAEEQLTRESDTESVEGSPAS